MWCSMHLVIFKWESKEKLSVSEKYIYHLINHVTRLNVINLCCCCFFFAQAHTFSNYLLQNNRKILNKKRKIRVSLTIYLHENDTNF